MFIVADLVEDILNVGWLTEWFPYLAQTPLDHYTSTTTSKAWPSIYSMHLLLQSRLKAFGGSVDNNDYNCWCIV